MTTTTTNCFFAPDSYQAINAAGDILTGRLRNGTLCGARMLTPADLDAAYALHVEVADVFEPQKLVYKKQKSRLSALIDGVGRGFAVYDKTSGQLLAQRFLNSAPTADDLPFVDIEQYPGLAVIGGATTKIACHGCGAMSLLTAAMRRILPRYDDIQHIGSVVTWGNWASLANNLNRSMLLPAVAIGIDPFDNSTIVSCLGDIRHPPALEDSTSTFVPHAASRLQTMLVTKALRSGSVITGIRRLQDYDGQDISGVYLRRTAAERTAAKGRAA